MRVLIVSQYFWPENFRINDLVGELCNRGHDVKVLTGQPNYPQGQIFKEFRTKPEQYTFYCGAQIERVPIIARGTTRLQLVGNYISYVLSAVVLGLWKLRRHTFDVVLVFAPSPITAALPALALRAWRGTPVVLWVLDLWPQTLEAINALRSKTMLRVVQGLVSFIYSRCDLVLAQSRSFLPEIERLSPPRLPIRYFPSWAETVYQAADTFPAQEVHDSEHYFDVMFAGNIGHAQDFPAILEAASLLKKRRHIRWLIVGDGRAAAAVRKEVQKRDLTKVFLFLGKQELERMPSFLKHADALLVTLKKERIFGMTIPGKLQAYLAAGIPILGMLDGEGAEIIKESGAGLVCPAGDGKALAEAVFALSQIPVEDLRKMGDQGRKYSKQHFDKTALVSDLIGKLDSVVRRRSETT